MGEGIGKAFKIILGLVLLVVAVWTYSWTFWGGAWWLSLVELIKGGLGIVIALIGLLFILIGWTE